MTVHTIISLGGNINRLPHACRLALNFPGAHLIISSEGDAARCLQIALDTGLPRERIHLDYRAWDTVTNFTKTTDQVKRFGTTDLHVVTDGFHMLRSFGIARIVYALSPVRCHPDPTSVGSPEAWRLVLSDWLRALVWRFTGYQHKWQNVYEERMPYFLQQAEIAAKL